MVFHVLFFFVVLITTLVASPTRNSAEFVFANFENNTGWTSNGIAWSLGMVTSAYVMVGECAHLCRCEVLVRLLSVTLPSCTSHLLTIGPLLPGYDSATHLSEEMKTPRVTVPRAMVGSIIINAAMGFALLIAILFCMGPLQDALGTQTGFPIIQIFYHITSGNKLATSALTSTIVLSASGATVGLLASASRTVWAFARDGAPPFSRWLSRVNPKHNVPANSVCCVAGILSLFGLLNIASTTAFNAILSLTVESLALSYLLPIAMLLYRRTRYPQDLVYGPWRLPRRCGMAANIIAILYNGYICVFLLFPPFKPVTAENMNYAGVVLGGVLILAALRWVTGANKSYNGPSTIMRGA